VRPHYYTDRGCGFYYETRPIDLEAPSEILARRSAIIHGLIDLFQLVTTRTENSLKG
jgi:hypothetical protein